MRHVLVTLYLVFLTAGFLYSVFRVRVPLIPEVLFQLSYQAMAPYQNYSTQNFDLAAEGLRDDGTWEPINMDIYLPFAPGERLVRTKMSTFGMRGEDARKVAYRKWAEQIRSLEAADGRAYEHVRIWNEHWPVSPAGFAYLRHSPFLERDLITTTL